MEHHEPRLYHIIDLSLPANGWIRTQQGMFPRSHSRRPAADTERIVVSPEPDGFIHCSFHRQVWPTIQRFFAEADGTIPDQLMVLQIDPYRTGAVVRTEPGTGGETDESGRPELFPHLYGSIPFSSVTAVLSPNAFRPYAIAVGDYTITEERHALSVDTAARYLSEESYWAKGRSRQTVALSVENSWVLTVVAPDGAMAGMARVITDWATMYYISDLFILPPHRGRGLGKALVQAIVEHPQLKKLKGILRTADACSLYEQFGFQRDGADSKGMKRDGVTSA